MYKRQDKYDLYIDNMSALKLISNPEFHQRAKHIDVKYNYVRDCFQNGKMIKYIMLKVMNKSLIYLRKLCQNQNLFI